MFGDSHLFCFFLTCGTQIVSELDEKCDLKLNHCTLVYTSIKAESKLPCNCAEINRVRSSLFHWNANKEVMNLPEPSGPIVTLSEKLFVPVNEHPEVCAEALFEDFYQICLNAWSPVQ